jgi:hypothetical protein
MVKNFNYAALLPKSSYKDFLLGLQNMLNVVFRFRTDGKVDIIDRNEILSGTAIDLQQYQVGTWTIGERSNLTLKFIPEYDKDDARYDQNFEDLSDRYQDYKDPVDTYDDLLLIASPDFGELRRVKDTGKIYEYKWKVVASEDEFGNGEQFDALGWEFVSTGPQPYVFANGEKEEEITSAFSALQHEPLLFGKIPVVNQKGNLLSMQSVWKDFSLRLIDANPLSVGAQNSLHWDDAGGLFETRWRKWAQFWATRQPVQSEFQFPLHMLLYVTENITSKFRTNEGEFIIEDIETEFGLNMIGRTKIKGYKI